MTVSSVLKVHIFLATDSPALSISGCAALAAVACAAKPTNTDTAQVRMFMYYLQPIYGLTE
jgi:hypothetical protein